MKTCLLKAMILFVLPSAFFLMPLVSFSQCMVYPVSFEAKVTASQYLVLGKVASQHCYTDDKGNIYTLNKLEVTAWAKNVLLQNDAYVITLGGIVGNKAQITTPALQLQTGKEYFLALDRDNTINDDKTFRLNNPAKIQAFVYSDEQGAMLLQDGYYYDRTDGKYRSEADLLQQVFSLTSQQAKTPGGSVFTPRYQPQARNARAVEAVTFFAPNPTNAGTIVPSEFLQITGTGFGTAPGTVEFRNADNGGATYVSVGDPTDYVTWTDTYIIVKVPSKAGTGTIRVNGMVSPIPLQIGYSHIPIYSTFNGFANSTRQQYYLRNLDGLGGYSFRYNISSGFDANTAAKAAFERALSTWRCSTGINWRSNGNTDIGFGSDGVNSVLFDATLPAGAAGRATTRFSTASAEGCTMFNTVWWLDEIDVQFLPVPATGYTWQYGPATPSGLQYDFESIAVHELGHAHGLDHRIAPAQVMHYSLPNGAAVRTPSAQEVSGGQAKVNYSIVPTCYDPPSSGTPMMVWSSGGCTSLPITLFTFDGALKNYGAELNWMSNDAASDGMFEIERSTNGITFVPIGNIKSKAGANTVETYRFIDRNVTRGLNYYRLKMTDKDGHYEYSKIIVIRQDGKVMTVTVLNNPAKNFIKLESSVDMELKMINATGVEVKRIRVRTGNNEINVSNVSNGIYYLINEAGKQNIKVSVLH